MDHFSRDVDDLGDALLDILNYAGTPGLEFTDLCLF